MVVIIDDEPEMRELLVEMLERENIEALAVDPSNSMEAIRRLQPEVVLLDITMPSISGYDILESIRSDPLLCDTFVIMVTGLVGVEEVTAGLERGADDYITKPFSMEELVVRVRRGFR